MTVKRELVHAPAAREALERLEASFIARKWSGLRPEDGKVRHAILSRFLTGATPNSDQLARSLGLTPSDIDNALGRLASCDLIVIDPDGEIAGAYPFSAVATGHTVRAGETSVWAMCAIDALGIGAMQRTDISVLSTCLDCGSPIEIRTRNAGVDIETASPASAVVWSGDHYETCAAGSLCSVQAFFCSDAHLDRWRERGSKGVRLTIPEAAQVGRAIFADALDPDFNPYAENPMTDIQLTSRLTCPECGHTTEEVMPTDACQYFYDCPNCAVVLKPKAGDCCVFCSYGDVKCPPIQEGQTCCA